MTHRIYELNFVLYCIRLVCVVLLADASHKEPNSKGITIAVRPVGHVI